MQLSVDEPGNDNHGQQSGMQPFLLLLGCFPVPEGRLAVFGLLEGWHAEGHSRIGRK
jgi:hypothetical protein